MTEKFKKTTTRTRIIAIAMGLILLFITYQILRITTLDEVISEEQVQNLDALTITIDFDWQKKAFIVDDSTSVESILDILSELKVWPTYFPLETYDKTIKTGYLIQFQYKQDANIPYIFLDIKDKNSLSIKGKDYKIVGGSDLENIYDLTILAQPENSLDPYYYDLMGSN